MCQNAGKNVLTIATVALNALSVVLKIEAPNDPNLAKYEADAQTLLGQLATWKSGDAATEIVQVIGLIEADVNLLPVPVPDQAVIAIALAGLSSIISIIEPQSASGGATQAAVLAHFGVSEPSDVPDPIYSGRYAAVRYSRDWNTQIDKRQHLKAARISNRDMLKEMLP